ncbi:hypothetical protein MN608_08616 [Microdochium nivale]|nr:hypothetical protein MN608_08616 [Microdochium nivale]
MISSRLTESYRRFSEYPANLVEDPNPRQTARDKKSFETKKYGLFRQEPSANILLCCRDFDDGSKDGFTIRNFRNEAALRQHLGEDLNAPPSAAHPLNLKTDPKCRVILLESNAPGERCLNATESMAKILFSYHQVPSCYLNLLTSHHAFGIDENYGAFFGHSTLKVLGREAPELGRSGRHIHVSYALRTTLLYVGEGELAARELLSDRQIAKRAAHDWLKPKVAIHHQFDLVTGKAVWFITTSMKPDPEINGRYKPILWGEHLRDFFKQQADSQAFQQPHIALDSSLQVHLILAQWTLGNLSDFLRFSEETLSRLTRRYIDLGTNVYENEDIIRLGNLMERLGLCLLDLQGNRKVITSLKLFYLAQFGQPDLQRASGSDCHNEGNRDAIDRFCFEVDSLLGELSNLKDRADALREMIDRRTNSMSTLLQKTLAEQGIREAASARSMQYIALLFLPVTVVSSAFSTDIIKFQDLSPGQVTSWSQDAFNYWIVTSICLTIFTFGLFGLWQRYRRGLPSLGDKEDSSEIDTKGFRHPLDEKQISRATGKRTHNTGGWTQFFRTPLMAEQIPIREDSAQNQSFLASAHAVRVPPPSTVLSYAPATYQPSAKRRRTRFLRPFASRSQRLSTIPAARVSGPSLLSSSSELSKKAVEYGTGNVDKSQAAMRE